MAPTSPSPSASAATTAHPGRVAPGEAKVGDKTWCPVSGEDFTVDASSPHVEHEGKTYYLCCPGCASRFQKDPTSYVDKLPR